jgi:hypothetical protein
MHAAMQLEILTGRPPQVQPSLEQDFWKAFPKLPAADSGRYLALGGMLAEHLAERIGLGPARAIRSDPVRLLPPQSRAARTYTRIRAPSG